MHQLGWLAALGNKAISVISGLLAATMLTYSGYVITDTIYTQKAAFSSWDLSQYRPVVEENGDLSFEQLLEVNPDTVAWITIPGTNIDYPVVQGQDDLEYANKDVFGNNSLTGSIYLTTANTRDFTNSFNLLYGHHMANGAMFGDIEKYEDEAYFHNHQDGILITTQGTYDLHIFARIATNAYDGRIYSAGDRKSSDFPDFLQYVQSLSVQWQEGTDIYDITDRVRRYLIAREQNIAENGQFVWTKMPYDAVENGMQLLAMSTCSDAVTDGRQVLFATMTFRTEPLPAAVTIDENKTPMAAWGHGQTQYWSILNLLCLMLILYTTVPFTYVTDKFQRDRLMEDIREHTEIRVNRRKIRRFQEKKKLGTIVEAGLLIISVIVFLYGDSFHNPMTIINEYTPWMILLAGCTWLADITFFGRVQKTELLKAVQA